MKETWFDKLWNRVLFPVADFFYPTNDCAVCYFWRAAFFGAWSHYVLLALLTGRWKLLFVLAVAGVAALLWMRHTDLPKD